LLTLQELASGEFEKAGQVAKGIFTGIGSAIGFFTSLIFIAIINFYLILDWDRIGSVLREIVPHQYREQTFDILDKIDSAVGGFLRGQLIVAVIVGGSFAAGLFFIGLIGFPALRNYCVLIGTLAGIGGFVPYWGPIVVITPAILIVLLTGGVVWGTKIATLAALIGLFSMIQAVEGFVLQPKIVGKGAGLHPLAVLFALVVGARFSIVGISAAIIRVLFIELYWKKTM
jgi:predicted PurR-regulated permease PerM